jgi:hypothetical protein
MGAVCYYVARNNMTNTLRTPVQTADTAVVHEAIWTPECRLVVLPDGSYPLLADMFAAYVDSPEGQNHLAQPPRFSAGFKCRELPDEVLSGLCADTHAVDHMNNVRFWFQQIASVDPHYFTPYTAQLGKTAAQFHDIGENTDKTLAFVAGVQTPPGDINRGCKTQVQRDDEEKIRRTAYQASIKPQLPGAIIEDMENLISHRARPSRSSAHDSYEHPLAIIDDALELAHSIGHIGVAGQGALYVSRHLAQGEPANSALIELSREVAESTMRELRTHAPVFKLAGIVARQHVWVNELLRGLTTGKIITV